MNDTLMYQAQLGRCLSALRRLGFDVRATARQRILVLRQVPVFAVPTTSDALADVVALGIWLVTERRAHGATGIAEA